MRLLLLLALLSTAASHVIKKRNIVRQPSIKDAAFNSFSFAPRSINNEQKYIQDAIAMFTELGFTKNYKIDSAKLAKFVGLVAKGYRPITYHNWAHGFSVAHTAYLLLRTPTVKAKLTELERFAFLIAALAHDLDHPGTNNDFQEKTNSNLKKDYKQPYLENHHLAQAKKILADPTANILNNLTPADKNIVMATIEKMIIDTDIGGHLKKVQEIRKVAEGKAHNKDLFMSLLMTAADLGDSTKKFHDAENSAEAIMTEFFQQGDQEKKLKVTVTPNFDRTTVSVPTGQIGFIDFLALPVFDMLAAAVPESKLALKNILDNKRVWVAMRDYFAKNGQAGRKGLDFLRDAALEAKMVAAASKSPDYKADYPKNWAPVSQLTVTALARAA